MPSQSDALPPQELYILHDIHQHPSIALFFLTMYLRKHLSNIILWLGYSLNGVQMILRGLVFSIYKSVH